MDSAEISSSAAASARPSQDAAWLTVDEAVACLALPSRTALYQAVRRGQVPAHRFGRRLRFRRAELDAALAPR